MENKVFIHKETGEMKTQIPIMELGNYREATEEEVKNYINKITDNYIESYGACIGDVSQCGNID